MYFIPRNNALYHHVAHLSSFYRYFYIFSGISLVIVIWLYGFYFPLEQRIKVNHVLIKQLIDQHEQRAMSAHTIKDLIQSIDMVKTDLSAHASSYNVDEYFKQQTLYIMDLIKKTDLKLDKYIVQQEKNKPSYKKSRAQLTVSGKFESIMNFLQTIKLSQKLITVSSVSISSLRSDVFTLRCDMGFALVTQA